MIHLNNYAYTFNDDIDTLEHRIEKINIIIDRLKHQIETYKTQIEYLDQTLLDVILIKDELVRKLNKVKEDNPL